MSDEKEYREANAATLSEPLLMTGGQAVNPDDEPQVLPMFTHPVGDANHFATWINIVKTFVGAGSFALPIAFSKAGIALGLIGVLSVIFLANYTMKVLIDVKFYMIDKLNFKKEVKYSDLGSAAGGKFGHAFVYAFVLMTNVGVCMAYINFCSLQVVNVCDYIWEYQPNQRLVSLAFFPLVFALSFIRSFKWLAPVSVMGSITLVISILLIFAWGIANPMTMPLNEYVWFDISELPGFYASACFLFCTHTMTLPLNAGAKEPRKYHIPLNIAFIMVGTVNMIFGLAGYMLYGHRLDADIGGLIFGALQGQHGATGVVLCVVEIALVLELLATFPAVLMPVVQYLEFSILGVQSTDKHRNHSFGRFCVGFAIRFFVVLAVVVMAASVKLFKDAVSLVGALTAATTGFVLPPLLRMAIRHSDPEYRWPTRAADIIMLVVAVPLTCLAVYMSAKDLYNSNAHDLDELWHKLF